MTAFHVKHFAAYAALLRRWQGVMNLVAPSTLADIEARHFADSAQLAPLIPPGAVVADLGSGAGFPGMVLALLRPDLTVHLIESDTKKAAFLKSVSRETLCAGAQVHACRVESLYDAITPDVVTARALAPLPKLCVLTEPWVRQNPALIALFMKGKTAREEIRQAETVWRFALDFVPSATATDGAILRLTRLTRASGCM
ncbi:MAG TPA: 16S rRNA (guanine(527)-N(7))-methyltransferase RsmG [Rhodospirillaceae bacterium]|jgi:16S rRNA (guanine527-N7)-methyltransferase|nr:16S rRNA (guanine(527)-N(7))-methyltransferase RsmG [Alphaproteobacteria bacterium]HBH26985.1 16S rRNA (guanine(527)-N(7))-methyltransferase RsmG [Rhodospirillaceae bacterium]